MRSRSLPQTEWKKGDVETIVRKGKHTWAGEFRCANTGMSPSPSRPELHHIWQDAAPRSVVWEIPQSGTEINQMERPNVQEVKVEMGRS